jgi:hypothetical protein
LAAVVEDASASTAIDERKSFRREGARASAIAKYVFTFSSLRNIGSFEEFGCRPKPADPFRTGMRKPVTTDDPALVKWA